MLGNFFLNLFSGTGRTSPAQAMSSAGELPSADTGSAPRAEPTPTDSPAATIDFSRVIAGIAGEPAQATSSVPALGRVVSEAGLGTVLSSAAGLVPARPAVSGAAAHTGTGSTGNAEAGNGTGQDGVIASIEHPEDLARTYALMAQKALVTANLAERLGRQEPSPVTGLGDVGDAHTGPRAA